MAEAVSAVLALEVVEDAFVHDGSNLCADKAARGRASERTDQRTREAPEKDAGWTGDDTDRTADASACESTGGARRAAADDADEAASFPSAVMRDDMK